MTRVAIDRDEEDREGTFGARIAALRPDVVIDLICFTAASARQLADALRPSRPLLIHGSLDALHEALAWLAANGQADVGGQEF